MRQRWTIDTNVPVVANGRGDGGRLVANPCRKAAVTFLVRFLQDGQCAVLDLEGEVEAEYRRHLNPKGQPGVGDRFYRELLRNWRLFERVELPRGPDGEYVDLPQPVAESGFDPSDRKFAALAKREGIPVVNAVDSDWLHARELLEANGIRVAFLCGCDAGRWFAPA